MLSSLIILQKIICLGNGKVTPANWLVYQLKNSDTQGIFIEMVQIVKNYKRKDLDAAIAQLRPWLTELLGPRLPCVFDEAQYIEKLGKEKFISGRISGKKRNLYHATAHAVLELFGDRKIQTDPNEESKKEQIHTLIFTVGTGLSIRFADETALSALGRHYNKLRYVAAKITNVLENAQQVQDYLKVYLPSDVVNNISIHDLDMFVGRRRFAATLAETILKNNQVSWSIRYIEQYLLDQLAEYWRGVATRIENETGTQQLFLDICKQLILAGLLGGRPLLLTTNQPGSNNPWLLPIFESGIGVLVAYDALPYRNIVSVKLMEPLVLRAGSIEFQVAQRVMNAPVGTSVSELGGLLERCLALTLTEIARKIMGKLTLAIHLG